MFKSQVFSLCKLPTIIPPDNRPFWPILGRSLAVVEGGYCTIVIHCNVWNVLQYIPIFYFRIKRVLWVWVCPPIWHPPHQELILEIMVIFHISYYGSNPYLFNFFQSFNHFLLFCFQGGKLYFYPSLSVTLELPPPAFPQLANIGRNFFGKAIAPPPIWNTRRTMNPNRFLCGGAWQRETPLCICRTPQRVIWEVTLIFSWVFWGHLCLSFKDSPLCGGGEECAGSFTWKCQLDFSLKVSKDNFFLLFQPSPTTCFLSKEHVFF